MPIRPLDLREPVWVGHAAANSFVMFADEKDWQPLLKYHSILRTELDVVLLPGLHQAMWEEYVWAKNRLELHHSTSYPTPFPPPSQDACTWARWSTCSGTRRTRWCSS